MGAKNSSQDQKRFFKIKEDKREGSKTKGRFIFFEQGKVNGEWTDIAEYNSMSGHIKNVFTKEYEWNNEKKEALVIELLDDEDNITNINITLGFRTNLATSILNTLAGEPILGVIQFDCGDVNKEGYGTLYIKNQGQKTKWKYSKEAGNWDSIPKITTEVDGEGNKIKKGVKANAEFWTNVLNKEVKPKLAPISAKEQIMQKNDNATATSTNDETEPLPF